jgi:hypothetical protein
MDKFFVETAIYRVSITLVFAEQLNSSRISRQIFSAKAEAAKHTGKL